MKYLFLSLMVLVNAAYANFNNSQLQFFEAKNLINNPGFEYGLSQWGNFGAAGSSLSTVSGSVSNIGSGSTSVAFDASATGQYLGSSLATIPAGLYGHACLARFNYKGADTNLSFLVVDESGSTLGSSTLLAKTLYSPGEINFTCPTSGSVGVRMSASGNAAAAFFDDIYVGENYKTTEAQPTVALKVTGDAPSASSAPIIFPTVTYDTHGGYSTVTGLYTVPITGYYKVGGVVEGDVAGTNLFVVVSGVSSYAGNFSATYFVATVSTTVFATAGQTISIQPAAPENCTAQSNWTLERVK